ncbi:hypothetical protein EFA46_012050 (plasmid) [Halarchaeum sp. CBA1220]|uniref:hypothetical protein n=1 Tax=Halarchaeum sp. CBA1220 TaxID=1853682 RepID=UPI000F3A8D9A|nr:hypothetical protein [Halarchaeum sp. CBA1220]QLC34983.1 hypothetical protein EFA46_012050 [Halarchaeum sp. CBA1220]
MRTIRTVAALLLAASLVATPVAVAADGFALHPGTELSTPERTVSIGGQDYRISSVGRFDVDGALTLTVEAPESADIYTINVYNGERQIVASKRVRESGTYTLGDSLDAGTYLAGVTYDGTLQTVVPVVVASYTATADASASVTRGDQLSVDATVDGPSSEPNRVDVVLFNGSYNRTVTATRVGDGEYNVLVDTESLAPGDYSYYVGVRGTERVAGTLELLGMSDRRSVSVESRDGTTTTTSGSTTSNDSGDSSGGSAGGGSAGGGATTSTTTTATTNTTRTTTTNATSTTTMVTSTTTDTATATTSTGGTTDGVLTPSDPTTGTATTSGGSPGFGVALGGLALLLALVARRVRR